MTVTVTGAPTPRFTGTSQAIRLGIPVGRWLGLGQPPCRIHMPTRVPSKLWSYWYLRYAISKAGQVVRWVCCVTLFVRRRRCSSDHDFGYRTAVTLGVSHDPAIFSVYPAQLLVRLIMICASPRRDGGI